jgi:hypothetical protein
VVNGAPLSFLQVVQWHRPTLTGWPLASIRMGAAVASGCACVGHPCSSLIGPNLHEADLGGRCGQRLVPAAFRGPLFESERAV